MPERVISPASSSTLLMEVSRRFEGANPGVALDVVTDMSGRDRVTGGKGRAPDHILHMLGDDFFIAHAVLHRAHRTVVVENVRHLRHAFRVWIALVATMP